MAPSEDLCNAALDLDGGKAAVANATYLAEKRANGQLSNEDYTLLQQIPILREEYPEQFLEQSRRSILRAYLRDSLTIEDVMCLLGVR